MTIAMRIFAQGIDDIFFLLSLPPKFGSNVDDDSERSHLQPVA